MWLQRLTVSRKWLSLGMSSLLLVGLATYLLVPGRTVHVEPDAIDVVVNDSAGDGPATGVVIRQHSGGPVLVMNWVLEGKVDREWKRLTGKTFPGGHLLDRHRELSFSVMRPAGPVACRVRVQYGVGLYGAHLWRERARLAWRTGHWMAALRYNEWEACESVAGLIQ